MLPPTDPSAHDLPTSDVGTDQAEGEGGDEREEVQVRTTPVCGAVTATPRGSAARRHSEVMMLTAAERRDKAADILADGVLRVLARDKVIEPAPDGLASQSGEGDQGAPPVIFRLPPGPSEAK